MKIAHIRIKQQIEALWKEQPKNASEAHFRAEKITRLEKLLKRSA